MKLKQVYIAKPSGFFINITASIVETPKGNIRTIEIVDNEITMTDRQPTRTTIFCCNDNDLTTNVEQLQELCKFLLDDLKNSKKKKTKKSIKK